MERLVAAVEKEKRKVDSSGLSGNAKLLAHLVDLAFDKIPRDPGNVAFRQGGTPGSNRKHWFRGKTGNGRYRLFYRYQSSARIIVYAWVNDDQSLRTRGSATDAYSVFAGMLDKGVPPDDWDALLTAASANKSRERTRSIRKRNG